MLPYVWSLFLSNSHLPDLNAKPCNSHAAKFACPTIPLCAHSSCLLDSSSFSALVALFDDSPGSFAAGFDDQNLSHILYNLTVVDNPNFILPLPCARGRTLTLGPARRSFLASSSCETNKSALPNLALAQLWNQRKRLQGTCLRTAHKLKYRGALLQNLR